MPSDSGEQTRARTFPSVRPAMKPNLPPLPFSAARRHPSPSADPTRRHPMALCRPEAEQKGPRLPARPGKLLAWQVRSRPALHQGCKSCPPGDCVPAAWGPPRPARAEPASSSRVWGTRPFHVGNHAPSHRRRGDPPASCPFPTGTSAVTAAAARAGPPPTPRSLRQVRLRCGRYAAGLGRCPRF